MTQQYLYNEPCALNPAVNPILHRQPIGVASTCCGASYSGYATKSEFNPNRPSLPFMASRQHLNNAMYHALIR